MKFIVDENCQFMGYRRSGTVLTVAEDIVKAEIGKGKKDNGKWISGLLQHCSPADDKTADFLDVDKKPKETDDTEEIEQIRAEFDSLGKGYDKRWQLKRLQSEIVKARKEVGLKVEEKTREDKIK